jgi:hypothetical protein
MLRSEAKQVHRARVVRFDRTAVVRDPPLEYDLAMAGSEHPADDSGPRVTIEQTPSATFGSASALALAFGSTILEPTWWPEDTGQRSYNLDGSSNRIHYSIGSIRADGVPILVVGFHEAGWDGRSPRDWLHGDWSEPRELQHVRGLVGRVGVPPVLQVVLYDQQLAMQLIGYETDDEIRCAVRSLRPVSPK